VHCVATPFLFIVQTCSVSGCCTGAPGWWGAIDYLFIGITFFAVFHSVKHSSKAWMKPAMYASWVILTLLIINEKMAFYPLPEMVKYVAAFGLISLHLYNLKYCQCDEEGEACCAIEAA
ncbi:MAG: MerC domain-containing protein, partial [Cyanobacteria bacterium J06649_11]